MKIFLACFFVTIAAAAVIPDVEIRFRRDTKEESQGYLHANDEESTEELLESEQIAPLPDASVLGEGAGDTNESYTPKTSHHLKYRQRRDVSEISPNYLPPTEETVPEVKSEYLPASEDIVAVETVPEVKSEEVVVEEGKPAEEPVEIQDTAVLTDDGYQYKTVRRLKYRQRRDVSEISPNYLPPAEETVPEVKSEYLPASEDIVAVETVPEVKSEEVVVEEGKPAEEPVEIQDTAVLTDDGYQYKNVRRLKYRQRRDVSEISPNYLPPAEETVPEVKSEYLPASEDIVVDEPVPEVKSEEVVVEEGKPAEEPVEIQDTSVLTDDGYQYKTVRRLKYRQRRDVSEISPNYLPPAEEAVPEVKSEYLPASEDIVVVETVPELKSEEVVVEEEKPAEEPVEIKDTAVLTDDGYQYKTVRRLKYRQRRDVSEISPNYLPPAEEAVPEVKSEYLPASEDIVAVETVPEVKSEEVVVEEEKPAEEPIEIQDTAVLTDDGYQYKTVRRLKYRQHRDVSEISQKYLPPAQEAVPEVKSEYLPASEDIVVVETVPEVKSEEVVVEEEKPAEEPVEIQDTAVLTDDGYQYKTVRRLKYRQRRDVSEISPNYLPPAEDAVPEVKSEYLPASEDIVAVETVPKVKSEEAIVEEEKPAEEPVEIQDTAVLSDDGYQYKTVRRLKYRQRRDVSEISQKYLPPAQEAVPEVKSEYLPASEDIVVDEPVPEVKSEEVVVEEEKPAEEPVEIQDTAILSDDGYQYKTVRRLKYRQRRDVSEISQKYLPPTEEAVPEVKSEYLPASEDIVVVETVPEVKSEEVVVEEEKPAEEPVEIQDTAVLSDDGYQYKTVRRLKYRQRRDVSEISQKYLPPTEEAVPEVKSEYLPASEDIVVVETVPEVKSEEAIVEEEKPAEEPVEIQDTAVLSDDGYQYKTVRRLKYRQRRDVSEISQKYLPPTEEAVPEVKSEYLPASEDIVVVETVPEVKSEEVVVEEEKPAEEPVEIQDTAILSDDGYQYKTVRRLKYRQRRDVSEISQKYLPPEEEAVPEVKSEYLPASEDIVVVETVPEVKSEEVVVEEEKPAEEPVEIQDTAVLSDDGYQYKTVRRLKYRQRRDVSEISQKYLPPAQEAVPEVKSEYLPASEDIVVVETVPEVKSEEVVVEEEKPAEEPVEIQDTAVLSDDGYQYKTVRRLKYRQRRDVSEISLKYLPPAQEAVPEVKSEYLPASEDIVVDEPVPEVKSEEVVVEEEKPAEEPVEIQDTAVLSDDGYQYKTVRRLKYRQRRDVSEISQKYLPPAQEAVPEVKSEYLPASEDIVVDEPVPEVKSEEVVVEEEIAAEEPIEIQDTAVLSDDGYQYKTVRRLKYRQRRDVSEISP